MKIPNNSEAGFHPAYDLCLIAFTYPHKPHQRMQHSYDLFVTLYALQTAVWSILPSILKNFHKQAVLLQGKSLTGPSNIYQAGCGGCISSHYAHLLGCSSMAWEQPESCPASCILMLTLFCYFLDRGKNFGYNNR